MTDKLHWLWPTLVYETEIRVDNIPEFNQRLLGGIIAHQKKHGSTQDLWQIQSNELDTLKREFTRSSKQWLIDSNLDEHLP